MRLVVLLAIGSLVMAFATLAYVTHRREPEYAVVDGWLEPEEGLFV